MKKIMPGCSLLYRLLFIPFTIVLTFASCKDHVETRSYYIKKAVYMNSSALREMEVASVEPVSLSVAGKIYVYDNYLLINEPGNGVHVVDNSNPSSPRFISFIRIPGNVDMAVNNNILYADSYIDLLVFDISNPLKIHLIKRLEDVFPNLYIDKVKQVFVSYKDTLITEVISESSGVGMLQQGAFFSSDASASKAYGQSYGQGGSTARFTLMNGHLYTVNNQELRLFNVDSAAEPRFVNNIRLGWGIETIFPYENKLFIGSTTGMHIYDASNPSAPSHLSTYRHFTSCDPVVVSGKYAFVTLRSGNFCQQGVNRLDVLDIENLYKPVLVRSYPMQNPHGLGISGSTLYLSEGDGGLKAFNISDVLKINERQLQHIRSLRAIDVIPAEKSLIVTGPDGIYQFGYSATGRLQQLSLIAGKQINN